MKLVLQSLFYGVILTIFSLVFLYSLDYSDALGDSFDLKVCNSSTRGFVWFHLVLVTELAIFSVRAQSLFCLNLPARALMSSLLLTCIVSALIAVFGSALPADNMGYVIAFNAVLFVLADSLKIWFRKVIRDEPGDVIETDDFIPADDVQHKPETVKFLEKEARFAVHRASVPPASDLAHQVEIVDDRSGLGGFFSDLRPTSISSGFIRKGHARAVGAVVRRRSPDPVLMKAADT